MAEINERLNLPDNIEVIRDQISAIIFSEMRNQYDLAIADDDPVADDYLTTVLVENDEPLQAGGDNDLFPIVNVSVDNVRRDGGASVNTSNRVASLNLDCYQIGNTSGKFAGRTAIIKAWKLARCIRAILESDQYTYLFLRGIVSKVRINSMTGGYPSGMDNSAVKVAVVRLVVEITYDQNSPQTTGPGLTILPVVISDENGQVVGNIKEEYS